MKGDLLLNPDQYLVAGQCPLVLEAEIVVERDLPDFLPVARNIPAGFARVGFLLRHFQGEVRGHLAAALASGRRRVPVRERSRSLDAVVPRPRARNDPRQRLRWAGGLLPAPRRADRPARQACCRGRLRRRTTLRARATTRSRSSFQDRSFNADGSLFYPASREFFDGFAGPYVPRAATSRRSSTRSSSRTRSWSTAERGPCLRGGAAPLPLQVPERLQLPLRDPQDRRRPARGATRAAGAAVLADRRRGRLPAGSSPARPAADGLWRSGLT